MSEKTEHLKEDMGIGYAGSGIVLGIRVAGDWTRALNSFAFDEGRRVRCAGGDQCKHICCVRVNERLLR